MKPIRLSKRLVPCRPIRGRRKELRGGLVRCTCVLEGGNGIRAGEHVEMTGAMVYVMRKLKGAK